MLFRVVAVVLVLLAPLQVKVGPGGGSLLTQSAKDDEFAEFEDDSDEFDFEVSDEVDDEFAAEDKAEVDEDEDDFDDVDDVDGPLEDDSESFETELDEEEFENAKVSPGKLDEIELSDSAVRMGPVWQTYVFEMVMVGGLVFYLVSYFVGRTKNSNMAYSWLKAHMDILQSNFAMVGDTGEGDEPTEGELVKVSDDSYTLWCSGRQSCSALLIHIQLCRRHDLMDYAIRLVQPKKDVISLIFQLGDEDEMDSFVLAIAPKKTLQKMQKDYEDLKNYTSNIRPVNKAEPLFFTSEIPEATQAFLSDKNCTFLAKYSTIVESVHITDQYTGFVQDSDDSETVVVKKPEKRIIVNFYASFGNEEEPYLKFALQVLDQIKNLRLSRESREKAQKNRMSVSSTLDKLQHTQRQEAAQQRREEKIRARKEKNMLLSESDPDKARKLEEKENRRARKKMQPKIKNMKIS